jgi:DNA repair ATPase RecN
VEQLDRAQRRQELARLSGGTPTQTMLDGAEELLLAAEQFKKETGG